MSSLGILIVEDERLVAGHIEDMVKRLGYQSVGIADSGEDAVRLTRERTPDLVLMDIRLRGEIDGIEAAEVIRKEAGLPVIYLSAYADNATIERGQDHRAGRIPHQTFRGKRPSHSHRDGRLQTQERNPAPEEGALALDDSDKHHRRRRLDRPGEPGDLHECHGRTADATEKAACMGLPVSEILRIAEEKDGIKIPILLGKPSRNKPLPSGKMDILLLRPEEDIPIELLATPIRDENSEIDGSVIVFRDIKERKEQERKLAFLAIHDSLTGLPNRILFNDHLTLALAGASRKGLKIAVLMLDPGPLQERQRHPGPRRGGSPSRSHSRTSRKMPSPGGHRGASRRRRIPGPSAGNRP